MIADVEPALEKGLLLRSLLCKLCRSYHGKPVLHILLLGIRLLTELVQIPVCCLLVGKGKYQIGTGYVCRSISLCGMYPVNDMVIAVLVHDYVRGAEISMAELGVKRHSLEPHQKLISCSLINAIEIIDLLLHLELQLTKPVSPVIMDLELKVQHDL